MKLTTLALRLLLGLNLALLLTLSIYWLVQCATSIEVKEVINQETLNQCKVYMIASLVTTLISLFSKIDIISLGLAISGIFTLTVGLAHLQKIPLVNFCMFFSLLTILLIAVANKKRTED